MATAAQYAEWIVRNKDKKGSPEFETVAKAYRLAKERESAAPAAEPAPEEAAPEVVAAERPSMRDVLRRRLMGGEVFETPQREAAAITAGMTPEQKAEAARTGLGLAASFAVGPAAGMALRGVGAALPVTQRVVQPLATAIESGGFRSGLGPDASRLAQAGMRVAGGATAGGLAAGVVEPEEALTGAAIGAAVPVAGRVVGRLVTPKGPKTEDVRKTATTAYEKVEELGGEIDPNQFTNLTYRLATKMDDARFNPVLHPRIQRTLDTFTTEATRGTPISLNQLDTLRRVAARAGASSSADEQRLGKLAVNEIDEFIRETMPEASVAMLEKARNLWARMSRSKLIDRVLKKALNKETGEPAKNIRQAFKTLRDRRDGAVLRTFSAEEQDLINKIADGTIPLKILEGAGALAAPPRLRELSTGLGRIGATGYTALGYGATAINPVFAAAAATGGYASRALANQLARVQAERLGTLIRTGAPAPQFAPAFFPQVAPAAAVNMLAPESENALR